VPRLPIDDSMTGSATLDEAYNDLRSNSLRIDLSDLILHQKGQENTLINLAAWITVESDDLQLHLRGVSDDEEFRKAKALFQKENKGVVRVTRSDHLQIEARCHTGNLVILDGVMPVSGHGSTNMSSGQPSISRMRIRFDRLVFPPEGFDDLQGEELSNLLKETNSPKGDRPTSNETNAPSRNPHDELFAILPGVEQQIFNCGTKQETKHPFHGSLPSSHTDCFTGNLNEGKFCLEKHEQGILVNFRRPIGVSSQTSARATFDGILQAIGFLHGCNPWPDYFCHRRDHRIVERWLKPRPKLGKDPLLPLSHRDLLSYILKTANLCF